ncbi:hypothetical protein [Cupriavidus necator]|uniref:hypothetical protein n=1 Tax=Cupriavidus necator TaxID=106590 RepID=UPI00129EE0D0|nr:hypothetical protein [Cupriavidus necator]
MPPARPARHVWPETSVVPRIPRRPGRHPPFLAHWWQPGVYGSVPAVALWILARLPAGLLASLAGTPAAAAWLNHAGDTVFVTGWAASALLLWLMRRRPAPACPAMPATPPSPPASPSRPSTRRHPAG